MHRCSSSDFGLTPPLPRAPSLSPQSTCSVSYSTSLSPAYFSSDFRSSFESRLLALGLSRCIGIHRACPDLSGGFIGEERNVYSQLVVQWVRSSGAQCIYTAIGLICANYAITTKVSTYAHSSITYFPTVLVLSQISFAYAQGDRGTRPLRSIMGLNPYTQA